MFSADRLWQRGPGFYCCVFRWQENSMLKCTPGSNTSFQDISISIRKWKKFHPLCLCLWGRLCNPGSHIFVSCLCLCLCLYQALTHDDNSGNNHDEMVRTRCLLPRQRQTKCSQKKRLGEGWDNLKFPFYSLTTLLLPIMLSPRHLVLSTTADVFYRRRHRHLLR